ncbi:MAG TPA: pyridoxamine 5'-phosphate oxidase family protein [Beutenbergiaceae bacterium]|nr:pyridoxamine 5'-phosphate oxidase family protein [Beutenbergiaceae bacterium]
MADPDDEERTNVELPKEARHRIESDHVAWLTTVTDSGVPAPNPVWFAAENGHLVVFSSPGAVRVHNIALRPNVSLHFNSSPDGNEVVVITARASLPDARPPSQVPAFVTKYRSSIEGAMGMSLGQVDAMMRTEIRLTPTRVRLTP